MSSEPYPGGESVSREEALDKLADQDRRMNEMGKAMASFRNRIEDVEAENEELKAANERLRETVADQAEKHDELRREYIRLARRLTAVEEEHGIDAATANAFGDGAETSPLYLLETIGPAAVADTPGPTLHRARVLVENKDRWGNVRSNPKYGRHRLLATTAHDLKQRLEDARDEDLAWNQVHRAMEKLATLGGDHVQFEERYASEGENYGKALVWQGVDGQ